MIRLDTFAIKNGLGCNVSFMKDFDQTPCPLCKTVKSHVLYSTRDYNWGYPGAFTYVECAGCGLVYENPRPQPEKIREWYPAYYGTLASMDLLDAENKIHLPVHALRAKVIEKYCSHGTLLDVGCGNGFFLDYMRRHGWNVRGLDPAPELTDYARTRLGLNNVQTASWPTTGGSPVEAHVVTLWHVLEHLEAPLEALLAVRNALTPAGILVIETPNIRSWPARIFGARSVALDAPRNLVLISRTTLQKVVEMAGFRILKMSSFSPSTMDYSESIRYLLRDKGMGHWPEKCCGISGKQEQPATDRGDRTHRFKAGPIRGTAMKAMHECENLIYRGLNQAAEYVSAGCNLLLVARRLKKD